MTTPYAGSSYIGEVQASPIQAALDRKRQEQELARLRERWSRQQAMSRLVGDYNVFGIDENTDPRALEAVQAYARDNPAETRTTSGNTMTAEMNGKKYEYTPAARVIRPSLYAPQVNEITARYSKEKQAADEFARSEAAKEADIERAIRLGKAGAEIKSATPEGRVASAQAEKLTQEAQRDARVATRREQQEVSAEDRITGAMPISMSAEVDRRARELYRSGMPPNDAIAAAQREAAEQAAALERLMEQQSGALTPQDFQARSQREKRYRELSGRDYAGTPARMIDAADYVSDDIAKLTQAAAEDDWTTTSDLTAARNGVQAIVAKLRNAGFRDPQAIAAVLRMVRERLLEADADYGSVVPQ